MKPAPPASSIASTGIPTSVLPAPPAGSDAWVFALFYGAIIVGGLLLWWRTYVRPKADAPVSKDAVVISAALADAEPIRRLGEAVRGNTEATRELAQEVNELRQQADSNAREQRLETRGVASEMRTAADALGNILRIMKGWTKP